VQICAPIRHGAHFHEKYLWNWLRPIIPCPTGRYIGTFEGHFPRHFVPSYDHAVPLGRKYILPVVGALIKSALMGLKPWAESYSPFFGAGPKGEDNSAQGLCS
jgi:hypothetical protein